MTRDYQGHYIATWREHGVEKDEKRHGWKMRDNI